MIRIDLSEIVRTQSDRKRRLQWEDINYAINSTLYKQFLHSSDPELFLSLRGFDYIDSDGLLWILLLGDFLIENGKMIWLELPDDKKQLYSLKESFFVEIAQENFSITNLYKLDSFDVPDQRINKKGKFLRFWKVDVTSINRLSLKYLHNTVSDILNVNIMNELDFLVVQPFVNLIIETNRNLVQHSRGKPGEGWGYFALSEKPAKHASRLTFTIADNGIGFSKSLKDKGYHIRSDQDAINKAFLFRYQNREGAGLFRAIQFASRLQGIIRVRSGEASSFLNFNNTYLENEDAVQHYINKMTRRRSEQTFFPGVQYYVEALGEKNAR